MTPPRFQPRERTKYTGSATIASAATPTLRRGPVSGLVLVEVVPPIDRQQREETSAEVELAERLDATRHQRLDDRRNERDRGQQSKRVTLAPVQLVPLRGCIRRTVV